MKQQIDLVEDLSPRIAATAVRNAISFEVKKDALQQRQNGDWMIRFVAQAIDLKPVDIDQVIVNAKMGTRYLCTLVELDADETPVDHQAKRRDEWRALGPVKQAGIRCTDPIFWAYLAEVHGYEMVEREQDAATIVRTICGVLTRSDLGKPGFTDQRIIWFDLDQKFQAWRAKENA